jgi:lipopolysaccharide biosynthesis glycosyltransferase
MRNLVFQINILPNNIKTSGRKKFVYSNELYTFSNDRAKEYANKNNADYFCLQESWEKLKEFGIPYQKLYVYELFKNYDKIFYVDSDAVITKICPNIFEVDIFSAVRDNKNINKQERKNEIHNLNENWNYFCSGIILFDKKFYENTKEYWQEELLNWKDVKNGQHDQSLLNVLAFKYYGKYNVLTPDWGAWYRKGKYITHYNGPQTLEWTREKFDKFENKL